MDPKGRRARPQSYAETRQAVKLCRRSLSSISDSVRLRVTAKMSAPQARTGDGYDGGVAMEAVDGGGADFAHIAAQQAERDAARLASPKRTRREKNHLRPSTPP